MAFIQEELFFLNQVYEDNIGKEDLISKLKTIDFSTDPNFFKGLISKVESMVDYDFSNSLSKALGKLQLDLDDDGAEYI